MENNLVELEMKVVPHKKSYARPLEQSEQWAKAKQNNQPFLYVTHKHHSQKFGNIFVLSQNVMTKTMGDFFIADDFELLEDGE
jgi:hypothetical protein